MANQSSFNTNDYALLLQLLERERAVLPVEIHHSATPDTKEYLRDRLNQIDQLIAKVKPVAQSMAGTGAQKGI